MIRNNDDIDFVTLAVFLLNYDVRDNWFFPAFDFLAKGRDSTIE